MFHAAKVSQRTAAPAPTPAPAPEPTPTPESPWTMPTPTNWFSEPRVKPYPPRAIHSKQPLPKEHPLFLTVLMKTFPHGILFSSDIKPTPEEILLQAQLGIPYGVFYAGQWNQFFKIVNDILMSTKASLPKDDKLYKLYTILIHLTSYKTPEQCTYKNTFNLLKTYSYYVKTNNTPYPRVTFMLPTPPGVSVTNVEKHLRYLIEQQVELSMPNISGKDLLFLFPGTKDMGVKAGLLIEKLDSLPRESRYQLSQNPQKWVSEHPFAVIQLGLTSIMHGPQSPQDPQDQLIPKNPSICVCSNCQMTVSDLTFGKYLQKLEDNQLSLCNNDNDNDNKLLSEPPCGKSPSFTEARNIAQKNLTVKCSECSAPQRFVSLLTKFTQLHHSKDFIDKLRKDLVTRAIKIQFPDIYCLICADDTVPLRDAFNDPACLNKHLPVICKTCQIAKHNEGIPASGKVITNSPYRCLGCMCLSTQYYGNPKLVDFLEKGGVHDGHNGRFCVGCMIPFQEPASCGAEESRASLHCPTCTETIAQHNTRLRRYVPCPNPECGIMMQRSSGCDVMKCNGCETSFCNGCSCIFENPPDFEWFWRCSCTMPDTEPREYDDPSISTCEDKYRAYQASRLGIDPSPVPELSPSPSPSPSPAPFPIPFPIPLPPLMGDVENDPDIQEQLRIAQEFEGDDALIAHLLTL